MYESVLKCPIMSKSVSICPPMSNEVREDPLSFLLSLKHSEDPQVSTTPLKHRKHAHCLYHYTAKAH